MSKDLFEVPQVDKSTKPTASPTNGWLWLISKVLKFVTKVWIEGFC